MGHNFLIKSSILVLAASLSTSSSFGNATVPGASGMNQQDSVAQMANSQNQAGAQMKAKAAEQFVTAAVCFGEEQDKQKKEQQEQQKQQLDEQIKAKDQEIADVQGNGGDKRDITVNSFEGLDKEQKDKLIAAMTSEVSSAGSSEIKRLRDEQAQLRQQRAAMNSTGGGGGMGSMLKCGAHILGGIMSMKAAKDLQKASKDNMSLSTALKTDAEDPLFKDPDILKDMPAIATPNPAANAPLEQNEIVGPAGSLIDESAGIEPELYEEEGLTGPPVDALRAKLNGPVTPDSGGSGGGGGGSGGGSGFGGGSDSNSLLDKLDTTKERPAGGVGKYSVAQGGSGSGVGKTPSAQPKSADPQKAFANLLKEMMAGADSAEKIDTSAITGLVGINGERDPASNLNQAGDESINVTSKSIFEIVSDRIKVSSRRGYVGDAEM